MIKKKLWMLSKLTISILIIGLLNYYLISGTNLSMQIGFILLGILIILNIFSNQTNKIEKVVYSWCAMLLILVGARSYGIDSFEPYQDRATDISYEIRTSLKNTNGNFSEMAIVTGTNRWDRLYLLPPYTDVNKFLKKIILRGRVIKKRTLNIKITQHF